MVILQHASSKIRPAHSDGPVQIPDPNSQIESSWLEAEKRFLTLRRRQRSDLRFQLCPERLKIGTTSEHEAFWPPERARSRSPELWGWWSGDLCWSQVCRGKIQKLKFRYGRITNECEGWEFLLVGARTDQSDQSLICSEYLEQPSALVSLTVWSCWSNLVRSAGNTWRRVPVTNRRRRPVGLVCISDVGLELTSYRCGSLIRSVRSEVDWSEHPVWSEVDGLVWLGKGKRVWV